jgi:SAM-dependent methyltransferase
MFKPVRCSVERETPYVRRFLPTVVAPKSGLVVDLGCGNLRNTKYVKSLGYNNVLSYDRVGDFGTELDLGREKIPIKPRKASIILCNYLLCFLNDKERQHLIKEIKRIAKKGCFLFVEMYPAKKAFPYDVADIWRSFSDSWSIKHISKDRFFIQRTK